MLYELLASFESVSFIGMCKNAGKTTALNRMIQELHRAGEAAALTSIGRDGESSDLVTNTVKPGIYVYRGTLLATAADLLKFCDITKEILYTTGIYTPLGEIVVVRALSDGFVQAAGPSLTTQMADVAELFRREQAGRILIDGALERKSISTRKVSESTILCTGASYHKDMRKVVGDTAYICRTLMLPAVPLEWPADSAGSAQPQAPEPAGGLARTEPQPQRSDTGNGPGQPGRPIQSAAGRLKFLPVDDNGAVRIPEQPVKPEELWQKKTADVPDTLFVQGGLTDGMVRPLLTGNTDLRGRRLILRDGSRILLGADTFEKLQLKGLDFAVEDGIRLLAVTVNPFSAYGFHFDGARFLEEMRRAVPVPVLDVRADG